MVIYGADGKEQTVYQSKIVSTRGSFSPDGKFIAMDVLDEAAKNTDVWIHDIQRNSDLRLTFDKAAEVVPVWSPDAGKIYYSSNRSGVFSIYQKNSNGTGDEQLVDKPSNPAYATDISSDGIKIMLSVNTGGLQKWDLGYYDLTEQKYVPLLSSEFNEWVGSFSPDGKWFAYQSDETGKYEVYIRPTNGSQSKWQASTNGGQGPTWAKSGKEIVYHTTNQSLMSVAVTITGSQVKVGQSRLLFKLDGGFQTTIIHKSNDGTKILVRRTKNTQSLRTAGIIMNWQKLLELK